MFGWIIAVTISKMDIKSCGYLYTVSDDHKLKHSALFLSV